MKKFKNIIIMLAVLGVLLAVYLIAAPMWSDEGEETTEPLPSHTVAEIDHMQLVGFELMKGEETLSFALNSSATEWDWSEDAEVPLDNMVFAEIVTAFNEAVSNYKLEGVTEAQLSDYGLTEPAYRVKFTYSNSSVKEYLIGMMNSFNSLYYFCEASATDTVYMVPSNFVSSLDLGIYDFVLIETPPTLTEGKLVDVNYVNGENYHTFRYYASGNSADYTDKYDWYVEHGSLGASSIPPARPLDTGVADTLVSLVTGMYFEECVGLDYADEKYGFSPANRIVIRYNADEGETGVLTEKTYTVYIGAQTEDGSVYAYTDNSKLVYKLGSSDEWIALLSSEYAELMPKEVWLPNYELIDYMTFATSAGSLTVNVKNTDGKISYSSDKSNDTDAIGALVSALEALKATSNIAYFEDDAAAVEKNELFSVIIGLKDKNAIEMKVTRFSMNYCLVSFNGREDQLLSLEDTQKFADTVSAFFAG
ncbi:MAG: DUF4340 domain-containing protein [Clostridia bacterium]|nr:DUF4340 domain-containing protein [Clostridia bacterium]